MLYCTHRQSQCHVGASCGSPILIVLSGACDAAHDGLYYVDDYNFAFCTGGKKVVQKCAEGSANPPLDYFKDGNYYGFYDFCSVNLIANGYNAQPYPAPAKPHRDTYVPEDSYAPEGYLETTHQETE